RRRVRLDGGRATILRRQELQERTQTLQSLQGKTGQSAGWRAGRAGAGGNGDHLFGLRQGNDRPVSADSGSPRLLQGMFPVPEVRRGRRRLISGPANRQSCSARLNGGNGVGRSRRRIFSV